MNKYKTYFLIPLLLIMFSCDEDKMHRGDYLIKEEKVSDKYLVSKQSSTLTTFPFNPSNPHDYYGDYHNQVCDHYMMYFQENVTQRFFEHQGVSYLTKPAFDNIVLAAQDYLINHLSYQPTVAQNYVNEVYDFFSNFGLNVTINNKQYVKILKDYRSALEYCNNSGLMNPALYSAIAPLYPNSSPYYSTAFMSDIASLESSQASLGWSNANINAFISTANHSSDFWKEPIATVPVPLPNGLDPRQAAVAADAMGLAIGNVYGGWIMGPIMTLAEIEDQKNGISILVGEEYEESKYYKDEVEVEPS